MVSRGVRVVCSLQAQSRMKMLKRMEGEAVEVECALYPPTHPPTHPYPPTYPPTNLPTDYPAPLPTRAPSYDDPYLRLDFPSAASLPPPCISVLDAAFGYDGCPLLYGAGIVL